MGGSAPEAPDYKGAAQQDATANHPNVNTPFGTQRWTQSPDGQWTMDLGLSDSQQAAYNAQQQAGVSNARAGLGLSGQIAENAAGGLNTSYLPSWASTPQMGTLNGYVPDAQIQGAVPQTSLQGRVQGVDFQNSIEGAPIQGQISGTNLQGSVAGTDIQGQLPQQSSVDWQRQYAYGNAPAMPESAQWANQQGIDAAMNQYQSRLDPQWQQAYNRQRSELINQGLDSSSEAYKTAMGNFDRSRNDAYQSAMNSAVQQGAQIGSQMFGQGMAARQQGVNEATNQGNLWNQTGMQGANLYNQANLAQGQFANQAANQQWQQNLGQGEFANNAANQQYMQNLGMGQFANQAANQLYQQNLGMGQFANQAAGQELAQNLSLGEFANNAANQGFAQNLAAGQFGNQAAGQQFGQDLAQAQFGNQALQNQYQGAMSSANYQNNARQQQLAELAYLNQYPLQMQQALFGQSPVSMPTPYSGPQSNGNLIAAGQLGNYNMNAYQAQQQFWGDLAQGVGSAVGGAAGLFAFSDKRLKKNIRRGGEVAPGVRSATWEWKGSGERDSGVIAQDVEKKYPEAVREDPEGSGYKQVNYAFLFDKKFQKKRKKGKG